VAITVQDQHGKTKVVPTAGSGCESVILMFVNSIRLKDPFT